MLCTCTNLRCGIRGSCYSEYGTTGLKTTEEKCGGKTWGKACVSLLTPFLMLTYRDLTYCPESVPR